MPENRRSVYAIEHRRNITTPWNRPLSLEVLEKEGLLPFVERSDSGARQFTDIDLEWLIIIDSLKRLECP